MDGEKRRSRDQFARTQLLLGAEAMERLYQKRVAVFGIGGVGGYVCEALVRSGIGAFDLIDSDTVSLTNLNRQIIATRKTLGQYKVDVMRDRMLEINPEVRVRVHKCFFLPENADEFPFGEYDYVVDAVDTVTAKIELILRAQKENVPVISAMGAGNKLDAGRLKIADIYETSVCPLAKVMRRELKKRGVEHLKVVYSDEEPIRPLEEQFGADADGLSLFEEGPGFSEEGKTGGSRRSVPGSTAFVPAVAGLLIAGEIVRDLSKEAR
ncbi:MAG: tRNA threonylcarbamoyladenosine dehydratase [Lachnospiraceae bacterium]|nr:tRNA threonylcarbamoyladenosine dehydratase [Lachnospiraceae bacterium]